MRTIRSSREIDGMFSRATRATHPLVLALVSPAADPAGSRVCFVAGRKLGGSVVRNRIKRVLREAVRHNGGPPVGLDLVLVARPGMLKASQPEADAAMAVLFARANGL